MKKIIFKVFLLCFSHMAIAQCEEPATVPYSITLEDIATPNLPDCVLTNYLTFASQEVFKSIPGPIEGYEGKLLAYNTITDSPGGGAMQSTVGANLYTKTILLEAGVDYTVSYQYGNSDPDKTILSMNVSLTQGGSNIPVVVASHTAITGAAATNYSSGPINVPETGSYHLVFYVESVENQGFLYLDTIKVEQTTLMGQEDRSFSGMSVYPNPVSDIVTIRNNDLLDQLEIYAVTGQLICKQPINALEHQVDMGKFSPGIYMLSVYAAGSVKKIKIYKR